MFPISYCLAILYARERAKAVALHGWTILLGKTWVRFVQRMVDVRNDNDDDGWEESTILCHTTIFDNFALIKAKTQVRRLNR